MHLLVRRGVPARHPHAFDARRTHFGEGAPGAAVDHRKVQTKEEAAIGARQWQRCVVHRPIPILSAYIMRLTTDSTRIKPDFRFLTSASFVKAFFFEPLHFDILSDL